MPIYEYLCRNGHRTEEIVLAGDTTEDILRCPHGLDDRRRQMSAPNVKLAWVPTVIDSAKEIWDGTPLEGTDGINSVHYKSDKLFMDGGAR